MITQPRYRQEGVKPVRLQLSRKRGFSLQALSIATNGLTAVNVARPSIFGNPFISSPEAPRSHAFEAGMFRDWMIEVLGATHLRKGEQQDLMRFMRRMAGGGDDSRLAAMGARISTALPLIRGKNLACWCKPGPCHADVLLEFANPYRQEGVS